MVILNPKELVSKFFNNTSNSYDIIVNWTTFGQDNSWKRKILDHLTNERTILDLACGTGILTKKLIEKLPHAQIVGVDVSPNYLKKAKEKLKIYENISFIQQDAEKLNLGKKFDCITASYLPKYCMPEILIKNCKSHLNKGGKIIFQDFTYPKSKIIRKLWNCYFVLLHGLGFFIPSWKPVFINLPELIRESNWVEEYEKTMKNHGLLVYRENQTWESSSILVGIDVS